MSAPTRTMPTLPADACANGLRRTVPALDEPWAFSFARSTEMIFRGSWPAWSTTNRSLRLRPYGRLERSGLEPVLTNAS